MATTVTNLKIEHERGMLTAELIVTRGLGGLVFIDGEANPNDLPHDIADALALWVLRREDQIDRYAVLQNAGQLP